MENFYALGLPQPLLLALEKMKFDKPTPIQAQAIPPALEGRDILGSAQTGTGKTAAFVIPMLVKLMGAKPVHEKAHGGQDKNNFHSGPQNSTALIMTPTRELAMQVLEAAELMLSQSRHIKTALLIGGSSMGKQLQQLRNKPRVIVGTPGRINDHLQQGTLNLSMADFLVLDETDRMLDMGFGPQIDRVVKKMPKVRQTLLFSATLPAHIVKIAAQYLNNPVRVAVGSLNQPIKKIQQELVRVQVADKYNALQKELRARTGSILIFVKTKRGADRMAIKLNAELGGQAIAIHGNLNQNQRNRVIQAFRDQKHRIMVATDVAARGLDIPHIEHVICYDLPQVAEDYIHRIGRTARNGQEGAAVCFITPEDNDMWRDIHMLLNPDEKGMPKDAFPGAAPANRNKGMPQRKRDNHNRTGFQHRSRSSGGIRSEYRDSRPANTDGGEQRRDNSGGERREGNFERRERPNTGGEHRSNNGGNRDRNNSERRDGQGGGFKPRFAGENKPRSTEERGPRSGGFKPSPGGERRAGSGEAFTGAGRSEERKPMKRGKKY